MPNRLYPFAVALASFATIALELLLTRIYSVTMYYHFAFMVISLALMGLAISGVALYLFPGFFGRRSAAFWGALGMLLFALSVLIALAVALGHPISLRAWQANVGTLCAIYFAASLPFLCSGFALSIAIASAGQRIGRVYAFDLMGAALGCLFVVPAVAWLEGPGALVAVAALGAAASTLFALSEHSPEHRSQAQQHSPRRGRWSSPLPWLGGAATVILAVLAVREPSHHLFGVARNPDKFLGRRPVLFEKWNAFSQITVAPANESDHRWLFIDADAATRMWKGTIREGGYLAPRRFPEVRVAALVYTLRHQGTALIIGPGGGTDVISALGHGVPRVVGVEVNPIIVDDVMRSAFADWNGDLYRDPRVEVVVDEGRSYIRRAREPFASIQATLVDTWAASSSGAFTLSENNIYTVEAFEEFLAHLEENGIVAVTRWYDAASPKEFLRLTALGRAALERRGVSAAELPRHFAIATDGDRRATLLLSRAPYGASDLESLRAAVAADGLRLLYTPGGRVAAQRGGDGGEDPLLHSFIEAPSAARALARLDYDAAATTDDRPFFFYNLRGRQLLSIFGRMKGLEINNLGIAILGLLLLLSILMTGILVMGPLLLLGRGDLRRDRSRKVRVLGYFLCLGLGYILVEIGFMQKFVLFLGHPIYALAVVLATLLAASGAGSALSSWGNGRFGLRGFVTRTCVVLAVLLSIYALGLSAIFYLFLGWPLVLRILLAILLIAPVGVLMGTLLPTGVRAANAFGGSGTGKIGGVGSVGLVAWAWSVNGAASVLGSILAMSLSMNFGFSASLGVGIAVYLLASLALPDVP